jgi:hypothetical protein
MAKCVSIGTKIVYCFWFAALLTAVGCGNRTTYVVDPEISSQAAIDQFDKDGDALLDETELKGCPGLLNALRAFDDTKDKKLSQQEIADEVDFMYQRNPGFTALNCSVTLDGNTLSGATVKFIPEKFLGEEIKTAEGITNGIGVASLSLPAEDLPKALRRTPALRVGIYRVEIEHPSKKIPAKYNTESELGFDFHAADHIQAPTFNLVSRAGAPRVQIESSPHPD